MSNSAKTLILGIGNTLLGDEGAGVRTMELLRDSHAGDCIEFVDGGTLSFTLSRYIEEADNLIVIDAANIGGAAGECRCFIDAEMDEFLSRGGRSVHEVSLSDLLDIARLVDRLPHRRALFGIQPQHVNWGEQLSPPVSCAVRDTAEKVRHLAETWREPRIHIPNGSGDSP